MTVSQVRLKLRTTRPRLYLFLAKACFLTLNPPAYIIEIDLFWSPCLQFLSGSAVTVTRMITLKYFPTSPEPRVSSAGEARPAEIWSNLPL